MLLVGLLLGVGGASFGIALSLGSGWFPSRYKGLAMGIAGAGNSGTVFAALFGPLLARRFGWPAVYGFSLLPLALAMASLAVFAKEPPDAESKSLGQSLRLLAQKDTWVFNALYVITFGGFIGLTNFLPTLFYESYGVDKVGAGRFTAAVVLMGSLARVAGGYVADRVGGIRVLEGVLALTCLGAALGGLLPPLPLMTLLLVLVFAGLGVGNGSVFQLVPLRYGGDTAVASSVIGELGALGGVLIPNAMAASQGLSGSFRLGFGAFAAAAAAVFVALWAVQRRWTTSWVGAGGKARTTPAAREPRVVMEPVLAMEIY
jgi:NNP family nitrate/nitrite transporter-like MFS transporter